MQPWENSGDLVHLELNSADASTAAALVAYNPLSGAVRTIGANEIVFVTSYIAVNNAASALTLDFFDDVNGNGAIDAGERIMPTYAAEASGGGAAGSFVHGRALEPGSTGKGKASAAGAVCFVAEGFVVQKWY